MALIDIINSLRQKGYNDSNIINLLQDQGVSPKEINEAMAQSKIKEAVSENFSEKNDEMTSDMQPSIISQKQNQQEQYEQYQTPYPEIPIPSPSQAQNTSQQLVPSYSQESPGYQEGYAYPQENYAEYGGQETGYEQYPQYIPDTSTITEIASQLISEKFAKTERALTDLAEFKSILNSKVEKVDERLKKIELIIDQLQMSLIRKSTAQEQNVEDIKSELKLMQNSFGKIINPLTDRAREVEETKPRKTAKPATKVKKPTKVSKKK